MSKKSDDVDTDDVDTDDDAGDDTNENADDDENNVACTICGDSNSYKDDLLVDCSNCKVLCHESCYGLQHKNRNSFTCFYCIELSQTTKQIKETKKCKLCSVSKSKLALTTIDGANENKINNKTSTTKTKKQKTKKQKTKKKAITSYGKWAHVICAYSFQCEFNNNTDQESVAKVIINPKEIAKKFNKTGKCCICNTAKGYKLKCIHPQCLCRVHPSCATMQVIRHCQQIDNDFYFADIYSDKLFRYPIFFCTEHNVENDNALNRKDAAIQIIKKWKINKQKFRKRKRKRKRKISNDSNASSHNNHENDANDDYHETDSNDDYHENDENDPNYSNDDNLEPKVKKRKLNDTEIESESESDSMIKKNNNMRDEFRYSMDKCYCLKCLKPEESEDDDIKMTDNNQEEEDETLWFNELIWFKRDYSFNEMNIQQKNKCVAHYCKNININTNYSTIYKPDIDEEDGNNNNNDMSFVLNAFESVTMYNYTAINKFETENNNKIKPGTLFEGKLYRDIFLNCGANIVCMDVCPLNKYFNLNAWNYLSLVTDTNKYHATTKDYSKNYLIQIWKIKKKDFSKSSKPTKRGWRRTKSKNAVFHYGIVHKHGFIWDIKWLPFKIKHKITQQNGENNNYQRLGILAVCSSHGVYIYSLPFILQNNMILNIKPIIKLSIKLANGEKFLRLSWSTNIVYPLLIAATTNGCIAIWDLYPITKGLDANYKDCKLLNDKQLNLIRGYSSNENVLAMDWCSDYLTYFITMSENGCLRVWDVNNLYAPIFTRELHAFSTDTKWISGAMDSVIVTSEAYASSKSTDCCTKFVSISPQQYLENNKMADVIQFPGEQLFDVRDKAALCMDILLQCECTDHNDGYGQNGNELISNKNVNLYVLIGYDSGNVLLFKHALNQLSNTRKRGKGQILSQLICDDKECTFMGPFCGHGINGDICKNDENNKDTKNRAIYDPYHLHATQLALNDKIAIKKAKICPNGQYLDIISASISGIVRIQTIPS